ncbi:MAG: AbrB/MazE/SpoVT family DNA-binding domain-containing protein [archaeon]
MVSINVTKISSKGQIVIPSEMRNNLKEGDELLIIKDDDRIILKKVSGVTEKMREDLDFAKRTEEAWQSYEKGEFISQSADKFLEELEKC